MTGSLRHDWRTPIFSHCNHLKLAEPSCCCNCEPQHESCEVWIAIHANYSCQRHYSWSMQLFVAELLEKIQLLKGFLKGPISFVVLRLNSRELVDNLSSHIRLKKGSHDPPANPNRSSAAAPVGPGDLKCPRHDGNCLVLPGAMTPKISKMGFLWFSFYWSIRINFFSM